MNEVRSATIELREAAESPGRIVGTLIETGRVAVDQKEVFVPGSIMFPSNGVELLAEHRGRRILRFMPEVDGSSVRIDAALPDNSLGREVAAEVRSGRKKGLSIEFFPTSEARVSGVREIRSALVDKVAVVRAPAYEQATVEVRQRRPFKFWL